MHEVSLRGASHRISFCNFGLVRGRFENQLGEMVEGVFPVVEIVGVFIDLPDVGDIVLL